MIHPAMRSHFVASCTIYASIVVDATLGITDQRNGNHHQVERSHRRCSINPFSARMAFCVSFGVSSEW